MEYQEGHLVDGRYSLQHFIGSGSFGEVWVAKDTQTDMEIAIKIYISMDQHGLEEFKKEFQVSFDLNQTNLLHSNYLGVNAEDNRAYLIMPFCPEGSVSSRIGQMSEKELWIFVRDVASGLAYLHGHNPPIIHQDIKPDNILISRNGDYLITDFGISRQVRNTLRRSARSANVAGAPAYMGPERFSGNPMPVKASDIWSFGATIYELATGDLPFCGMGGVMQKNGADMTELPDHFSEAFKSLVYRCLALETWDRPAAKDLVEEARQQLRNLDVLGRTVPIEKAVQEAAVPEEKKTVEDNRKTQIISVAEQENIEDKPAEAPVRAKEAPQGMGNQTVRLDENMPKADLGQTVVMSEPLPPAREGNVFTDNISTKEENKSFGPVVWVVASLVGICFGFLVNLFV